MIMYTLTCSNNVVLPRLKRMAILLNYSTVFIPQREFALKFDDNLHHRVEVGICDAVGKKEAAKLSSRIVGAVEVDVSPF